MHCAYTFILEIPPHAKTTASIPDRNFLQVWLRISPVHVGHYLGDLGFEGGQDVMRC